VDENISLFLANGKRLSKRINVTGPKLLVNKMYPQIDDNHSRITNTLNLFLSVENKVTLSFIFGDIFTPSRKFSILTIRTANSHNSEIYSSLLNVQQFTLLSDTFPFSLSAIYNIYRNCFLILV